MTAEEFSFYIEEKQTRFLESSDSDIKKLVANAVPESTRKSTNHTVSVFEGEELTNRSKERKILAALENAVIQTLHGHSVFHG